MSVQSSASRSRKKSSRKARARAAAGASRHTASRHATKRAAASGTAAPGARGALRIYEEKRDFTATPEPPPARRARKSAPLEFVVQRHQARRLHYDFRLEWDGVLKSWAVPKGPSLAPAEKRLAVETEDHPLEYRTFAGTIPQGQYGAGKVEIWDRGTYTTEGDLDRQKKNGRIDFVLDGRRLKGQWTLVRLRRAKAAEWLLIKKRDAHAARQRPARSGGRAATRAPRKTVTAGQPSSAHRPTAAPAARAVAQISHPDRIVFPEDGITKRELADYYIALAPALWPHLEARPLSILRSVATGKNFFQRHLEGSLAEGFEFIEPAADSSAKRPWFAAMRPEALAGLAQMAAIELHTWGSSLPQATCADRFTFDIDPDSSVPWASVCQAATSIRDFLAEIGLESQLKTTGGLGLHVVVPLEGRLPDFDTAASFAKSVAALFARRQPDLFTARRGAANRTNRMYIDWQRNQEGATTVAAYSPRWRKGAPVSMPLAWSELGKVDLRGAHFNLRNALAHYRERGDPWLEKPCRKQALSASVQRELERLAG